jgi:hypothetical protein
MYVIAFGSLIIQYYLLDILTSLNSEDKGVLGGVITSMLFIILPEVYKKARKKIFRKIQSEEYHVEDYTI